MEIDHDETADALALLEHHFEFAKASLKRAVAAGAGRSMRAHHLSVAQRNVGNVARAIERAIEQEARWVNVPSETSITGWRRILRDRDAPVEPAPSSNSRPGARGDTPFPA